MWCGMHNVNGKLAVLHLFACIQLGALRSWMYCISTGLPQGFYFLHIHSTPWVRCSEPLLTRHCEVMQMLHLCWILWTSFTWENIPRTATLYDFRRRRAVLWQGKRIIMALCAPLWPFSCLLRFRGELSQPWCCLHHWLPFSLLCDDTERWHHGLLIWLSQRDIFPASRSCKQFSTPRALRHSVKSVSKVAVRLIGSLVRRHLINFYSNWEKFTGSCQDLFLYTQLRIEFNFF